MHTKPETVDDYIDQAAPDAQEKLREMRECIRSAAPDASESLKWSMPAFSYDRILVTYAAAKHHIGFYPTPSAITAFADELEEYHYAAGSIQFPLDKPLPKALISEITQFRAKELKDNDTHWK